MKFIGNIFASIGAGFGILVFGGYLVAGPSEVLSFLGSEMPQWGDGIAGSILWLADYCWKYLIGAYLISMAFLIVGHVKRTSRSEGTQSSE